MSAPAPAPSSGWKVTSTVETKQLPPGAQNFVDGYKVTYVTGAGVTASVFVPLSQYTAANVTAAINAAAATSDAIVGLTATAGG